MRVRPPVTFASSSSAAKIHLPRAFLVFDLDGTLVDSSPAAEIAGNAMLEHFGLQKMNPGVMAKFVGGGERALVERALAERVLHHNQSISLDEATEVYRKSYLEEGVAAVTLYSGVKATIERLASGDLGAVSLAILTNKNDSLADAILENLGIQRYFFQGSKSFVMGNSSALKPKPDPSGLRTLMALSPVDTAVTMMIGDMEIDINTGRAAGVSTCGIIHSSDTAEMIAAEGIFKKAGATHIIKQFSAIESLVDSLIRV